MTDAVLISFGAAVTFTAFCGAYIYLRNGTRSEPVRPRRRTTRASARQPHVAGAPH